MNLLSFCSLFISRTKEKKTADVKSKDYSRFPSVSGTLVEQIPLPASPPASTVKPSQASGSATETHIGSGPHPDPGIISGPPSVAPVQTQNIGPSGILGGQIMPPAYASASTIQTSQTSVLATGTLVSGPPPVTAGMGQVPVLSTGLLPVPPTIEPVPSPSWNHDPFSGPPDVRPMQPQNIGPFMGQPGFGPLLPQNTAPFSVPPPRIPQIPPPWPERDYYWYSPHQPPPGVAPFPEWNYREYDPSLPPPGMGQWPEPDYYRYKTYIIDIICYLSNVFTQRLGHPNYLQ